MIQEMVIDETKKQIRKRVREDIEKEVESKLKKQMRLDSLNKISQIYSVILPEIVTDMVCSIVNDVGRRDFRRIYPKINSDVMDYAIEIAETVTRTCIVHRLETGEDDFYNTDSDDDMPSVFGFLDDSDF